MSVVRVYFDHNASTPVDPRVLDRYCTVERNYPSNPSSLHHSGRAAGAMLEAAREEVAAAFGLRSEDVLFVSGGTEANNLVVQTLGDRSLPVLCGPVEHPSVYDAAARRGRVEFAVEADGTVRVQRPSAPVGLCCLVQGQNEVGTLQPIDRVAALARELDLRLHVDAAQSIGRVDISEVVELADSITISPHKFGGLRGCGILVGRAVRRIDPLFLGGGQEFGLRPGTPSPALAAANALAVKLAIDERGDRARRMNAGRMAFLAELGDDVLRIVTPIDRSLPNTVMCEFADVDGRSLLPALDMAGVDASAGSACSSGSPVPPRVLSAMGLDEVTARRCVRFSFSHLTSPAEAGEGGRRVRAVVDRLRLAHEV